MSLKPGTVYIENYDHLNNQLCLVLSNKSRYQNVNIILDQKGIVHSQHFMLPYDKIVIVVTSRSTPSIA